MSDADTALSSNETLSLFLSQTCKRIVRPVRVDQDRAFILLNTGREAIIDAEDYRLVAHRNWCELRARGSSYAVTSMRLDGQNVQVALHRLLARAPHNMFVDHINRDGLDNRKANLRLATPQQNACNRAINVNNTSGYKGVSWHAHNKKWRATISNNRKLKTLGYFDRPEDAHAAYCKASAELHGEFGRVA